MNHCLLIQMGNELHMYVCTHTCPKTLWLWTHRKQNFMYLIIKGSTPNSYHGTKVWQTEENPFSSLWNCWYTSHWSWWLMVCIAFMQDVGTGIILMSVIPCGWSDFSKCSPQLKSHHILGPCQGQQMGSHYFQDPMSSFHLSGEESPHSSLV